LKWRKITYPCENPIEIPQNRKSPQKTHETPPQNSHETPEKITTISKPKQPRLRQRSPRRKTSKELRRHTRQQLRQERLAHRGLGFGRPAGDGQGIQVQGKPPEKCRKKKKKLEPHRVMWGNTWNIWKI